MMKSCLMKIVLTTLVTLGGAADWAAAETIVPAGGKWSWLHPTEGFDPAKSDDDFHSTFFTLEFDDSSWKSGQDSAGPHGGFGYGEQGFTGVDIGLPENSNDRKTAYFRHSFNTSKKFTDLKLKCQRDDGVVIYLDGKEVGRDNVGDGKDEFALFAVKTIGGEDETKVVEIKLAGSLGGGDHVLAISLHNRPQGSSDLRIAEISLEGTPE